MHRKECVWGEGGEVGRVRVWPRGRQIDALRVGDYEPDSWIWPLGIPSIRVKCGICPKVYPSAGKQAPCLKSMHTSEGARR